MGRILRYIPPCLLSVATIAAILWLTLSPQPTGEIQMPLFNGADKVAHAFMFGFLTLCLWIDRGKLRKRDTPGGTLLCALIASSLGILIEYFQKWMDSGRSFEYADMIADICGAATVALLLISATSHKKNP